MSGSSNIWHKVFGRPIASKYAHAERLSVLMALPVFASDALSSTAYAGEEILLKLQNGGSDMYRYLVPIAAALLCLLWIVIFSYRQTIYAYPTGGGSYSVASQNLGQFYGLFAAGSLLIGYILTVSVSVSAGASAVAAMLPQTRDYVPYMASLAVLVVTYLNLRGAKESGVVFSIPTYAFIALLVAVIGTGLFKMTTGVGAPVLEPHDAVPGWNNMGMAMFLFVAFASGCTALTGTEAIANGVLAFKAPEAKNAVKTITLMGCVLTVLFFGTSFMANHFNVAPKHFGDPDYMPVLAQVAERIFGAGSIGFNLTQIATALILVLAANTAYADFPRLSMVVAKDGYLPRQLMTLGDRLVFVNGIIALAFVSVVVILVTGGNTHQMLPMYAVSVFTTFTLSQAGMVAYWAKRMDKGVVVKMIFNGLGALVCGGVTLLLMVTRFKEGAWITLIAMTAMMLFFSQIRKHYDWLGSRLTVTQEDKVIPSTLTVLLLVPRLHKGILSAISYAQALSKDVRAVHVTLDPRSAQLVKEEWNRFGQDIPMVILESPYRSLVWPVIDYVEETIREHANENHMVTVIVPQAIPQNWWQAFLHSNAAWQLKRALKTRKNVVVANVRYFLE